MMYDELPIGVTQRKIATNGIELHCLEAGPANGPLVVLVHGFPGSSQFDAFFESTRSKTIPHVQNSATLGDIS